MDRYERVEPQSCPVCGGNHFQQSQATIKRQVVPQLVERPIEIVEYQQVGRILSGAENFSRSRIDKTHKICIETRVPLLDLVHQYRHQQFRVSQPPPFATLGKGGWGDA